MFPQKKLKEIARKKQVLKARNDLLRDECGEIWSLVGWRTASMEERMRQVFDIHPAAYSAAMTVLSLVEREYGSRSRMVSPIVAALGFGLRLFRSPAPPAPKLSRGGALGE